MRCFISIEIPNGIKDEIIKIQDSLPSFIGKKVERENLHLTLKFLGEINNEELKIVQEKLNTIRSEILQLCMINLGCFFKDKRIVVWIRLNGCEKLQKDIDESLKSLFEKEKRFMAHLTIARVKDIVNKEEFIKGINIIKIPNLSFTSNSFNLMRSDLSRYGSHHTIIKSYSLFHYS